MIERLSLGARQLFPELGLSCPLLLAGMGGIAGPELVAAVSNAGAAGILGLYKAPSEWIASLVSETERLTRGVYGMNWVPEVLDEPALLERISLAVEVSRASAFVSFFGLPPTSASDLVHKARRKLVIQVGSEEEAIAAADLGADAIIVQGIEAGGHLLGTQGVRSVLAATRKRFPDSALFVAGAVGSGKDLGALVESGADGACCGTLFIPALESRAHPSFKQAVLASSSESTVVSELYDIGWHGRPHRVIRTPRVVEGRSAPTTFVAKTRVYGAWLPIPRYSAAAPTLETIGSVEEMAFYCGTSCSSVMAELPAQTIVAQFNNELEDYFQRSAIGGAAEQNKWTSPSRA